MHYYPESYDSFMTSFYLVLLHLEVVWHTGPSWERLVFEVFENESNLQEL